MTALRLVGLSLLLLAGYLIVDSFQALIAQEAPQASFPGMGIAVLSLIVMPLLGRANPPPAPEGVEEQAAEQDHGEVAADRRLEGIRDPLAALLMTPILVREGLEGLRGERCECAACGTPACTCAH
ncbi:MAG: hypothetical protein ACRDF5_07200 [bacterium]